MYTKKVIEYFNNPINFGVIENAEGIGIIENEICSDIIKIYIRTNKDNTIEMYNIHGKKPESWKGIYPPADNTIKYLPERLAVGNSTYWVVRTSVQTLIYPFYGGEPLTKFSGDAMFLPTAVVKVKDAATIEAESYDGKVRSVKVK